MLSTQSSLDLQSPERRVLTVSQLNRAAHDLLEGGFPLLWVEGELSNLARPASGHWYFSLKDSAAQVRCALFRARANLLRFKPADGLHVLVRARVSLYEARGDYQLIVEQMEEAGHGALQRAFEELKQKLAREGLFDVAYKKPLPAAPHTIGVVTSPSGAALRDVLSVIRRRYALARVIVYPVPVQGEDAAPRIAAMIRTAAARAECDLLILARGGGSLEDLWAFNEEIVARSIHACPIPIVTGIGHEIDFTIADFVADLRAPTPTGAAELATPDCAAWQRGLDETGKRLASLVAEKLTTLHQHLDWCAERLGQLHPARLLRERAQRLDELDLRLQQAARSALHSGSSRLAALLARLQAENPARALGSLHGQNTALEQRLMLAVRHVFDAAGNRLQLAARALNAISPLATLDRGYAILSDAATGTVIASVHKARTGQPIHARLADGELRARIETIAQARKT